jgi:hypothetical protein
VKHTLDETFDSLMCAVGQVAYDVSQALDHAFGPLVAKRDETLPQGSDGSV